MTPDSWLWGGTNSHRVTPRETNMHIIDTNKGQFAPGHTVVLNRNGRVDHYAPGTVPENVVSKESIDLANQLAAASKAAQIRKRKRNSGGQSDTVKKPRAGQLP